MDVDVDLGDMWNQIMETVQLVCCLQLRVTQLFILHRSYRTPELLHRIGRMENPECSRCAQSPGSFIQQFWRCPNLHHYWQDVIDVINYVYNTALTLDPFYVS